MVGEEGTGVGDGGVKINNELMYFFTKSSLLRPKPSLFFVKLIKSSNKRLEHTC